MRGSIRAAAFDDPRFEPERLRAAARTVLGPLEEVSSDNELIPLWRACFGRWLPAGWRRHRLAGGWGAEVVIRKLEIVTVRNVGAQEPGEVVFRAWLRVRRWPRLPLLGAFVRSLPRRSLVVWLTFVAQPGQSWEYSRADFGPAGEYHLAAETVTEPARNPALHDATVHELAKDEAAPGAPLISTEGDAAQRLLDVSLDDGRYAPAVVEASVRSLIRAWRQLTIGDDDAYHAFAELSSYDIVEYARSADLPVSVRAIDVVALVPSPRPALYLKLAAFVKVPDGTRERILWWQLELDDELEQHWRLVDAYARPELRTLGER